MLGSSFRLVTARLIPRPFRCKQALLLGTLILAGCGGSGAPKAQQWQTVRTEAFRFRAPHAWTVQTTAARTVARDGSDFVQVATFPLAKPYTGGLFTKVEPELADRMAAVAKLARAKVVGHRVVTVDGAKAHAFDLRANGRTSRYTFVLRGKREFLLLCSADDDAVCDELAASFAAV
jgi:hypothetical protein